MIFNTMQGKRLYKTMSISCSLSFCLFGYDAGVLGGVQNTEPFLQALGNPTGTYIIPMVASSYVLAALIVSVLVMFVGMPLGRRRCILMGNSLVIVGAAIQASAMSVPHIIVGRIITGFGIGFISCTVPTYMAEMSIKSKERGPEVALQCAWLITGIAIAYWIDFGFTRLNSQISWRVPIALQAIFAAVSLALMLLLPDTPRWYYAQNRNTEGDAVLAQLHSLPIEHENVQRQKNEIITSIALEDQDQNKLTIKSLFWDNTELQAGRRTMIAFMLLALQECMGINMLVYYSTRIFANMGLSNFLSQLLAAVMNTGYAMGTWALPRTIERFGRRSIMLWSAVACAISMLGFVIMIGQPHQTFATEWTAVGFIIVFNFGLGYGWVGIAWLYGAEIAPLKYRHIGAAAGATGEWLFSFVTVFAGGIAIQRIGWRIWIWQIISCVASIIFVYYFCPETGGKSLEEIDILFVKSNGDIDVENGDDKESGKVSMVENVLH